MQKYLTAVSAVLSDAKRNEIIPKNPARMIDLPKTESTAQYIPSDLQAQELMKALLGEESHFRMFYTLAIYTGCRRGELCALKWSDIDILGERGILTVKHSRSVVAGERVVDGPTKNGRSRIIVLDNIMVGLIEYYQEIKWKEQRGKMSDYLFVDKTGSLLHPDTFTKRLRKIYNTLDFPKSFHLHTLRHYFVSTMLHSGVDKQTVADLAGHGDTSFLERTYCHPQLELKKDAAIQMACNLFLPDNCSYYSQKADHR